MGKFQRLCDLPLNLYLTQHEGLQPTGNFKEMPFCFFMSEVVGVDLQLFNLNLAGLAQHSEQRHPVTFRRADSVPLQPVTCAEQDILMRYVSCCLEYLRYLRR